MSNKNFVYGNLLNPEGNTYDEIVESLGLGFTAERREIIVKDNSGNDVGIPDKVAIWHKENDCYLSTVGRNYGLVQYRFAFSLAEVLLGEGIKVIRGGPLNRGESAVLVLQAPGVLDLGNGNEIVNECVLRSTHDGTGRIEVRTTPRNVNTGVVLTTNTSRPLSFKHSKRAIERVSDAKKTFRRITSEWENFTKAAKVLMTVRMNQEHQRGFIASVIEGKQDSNGEVGVACNRIREEIFNLFHNGLSSRLPACNGTLFGLVMAIAEWADYVKTVKKSRRYNEEATEFNVRIIGDAAKKKAKAWSMALALKNKVQVSL